VSASGQPPVITSPANPRLKALAALRRRRVRDTEGLTIVEGFEELQLACRSGVVPRSLYFCPELTRAGEEGASLVRQAAAAGAEVFEVGRAAFERAAYREGPDGFLAVVATSRRRCTDLTLPENALVLVCEGVEKPGNLGAMLRSADAAGVHAVIACDPVTDWGNPNVVRSSKGTVFTVPVATDPALATLSWLADQSVAVVASTPDTDVAHTDVDYTGAVAIVVGAEKDGLTAGTLGAADHRVRIPMAGQANSLNVSTSAAVLLYEVVRQRRVLGDF